MDIKKPSGKTIKPAIAIVGGGVAGAMTSRAVIGFIDKAPTPNADAATAKKEENALLLKRGVVALAGVALAAAVSGNDSTTDVVKGAGAGMAIAQGLEIVKTLSERSGVTQANATTSTAKKALANAVGLNGGCGCNGSLNGRRKRRGLNAAYPTYDSSNMDTYAVAQVDPFVVPLNAPAYEVPFLG